LRKKDDREPNPQEAQRNGQSAISQDEPLRELHQEGDAQTDRPIGSTLVTPELSDEEVSISCDIERAGAIKPNREPIIKSLIARGFIALVDDPLSRAKLTNRAQEILSKRGAGLNES
jgi:hypothetical protein